jgi:hypothetical protein
MGTENSEPEVIVLDVNIGTGTLERYVPECKINPLVVGETEGAALDASLEGLKHAATD